MPTRANRDTNSYGMKVGNGAQAPHTEIEDRICLNILGAEFSRVWWHYFFSVARSPDFHPFFT